MNEVVEKVAALGVPGLILVLAVNATGLYGAAALTTALAALGPGGMVGGIVTLGVVGLLAEAIAKWGVETVFSAVLKQLYRNGETKGSIISQIKKMPITKSLKLKLIDKVKYYS